MNGSNPLDVSPAWERKALLTLIAGLVLLSVWLAVFRVYQVDEAQNAYMAWVMGAGLSKQLYVSAPFFMAPFAWLSRFAGSAETVFLQARLGFCLLFWVNIMLIVKAAGLRLRSRAGIWTLAGVALLPPLWTYGLEVRHENWILCGLLLMWVVGRRCSNRPWAYVGLGLIACLMQLCAFKAIAYWLPLSIGFLLLPPSEVDRSRPRLAMEWVAGGLIGCLLGLVLHLSLGTLHDYLTDQANLFHAASSVVRFGPWSALSKLLTQTPLLLAVLVIPGVALVGQAIRSGRAAWTWDGPLPETLLWLWTCLLIGVNPNPFPYNLVSISACGALAVIAILRHPPMKGLLVRRDHRALLLGLLIFAQGVPFAVQTGRLLEATNDRQIQLMAWAEQLTDPAKDTVFDAAGLVPTRRSATYEWFVNLTNADGFRNGPRGSLRQAIEHDAPAVVIPTYRFSYLSPADIEAVRANYIGLAPDLWVLGVKLDPGGQTWVCRHAGRYALALAGEQKPGTWIKLDGEPADPGVYSLAPGPHTIQASPGCGAVVEWVGPGLGAPLKVAAEGAIRGVFPIPNAF